MRVAVVGAGLAGIAAARELVAGGHEVVVFEKSRGLGGRVAARRAEGAVLDHGSPVVAAPPGSALRALIDATPAEDRVDLDDGIAYAAGATRLLKILAAGLDVRLGVRLAALRATSDGRLEPGDEQGNAHGPVDAVVVTAPAPQAADLIGPDDPSRARALRGLAYEPAVMILAGVALGADGAWVVRRPAAGPLAEIRNEAAKGRPADGGVTPVVARLDAAAAARLLDAADEAALAEALPALGDALGLGGADPAWAQVKRWRFAVPAGWLDEEALNPPGSRVIVAGDAVTGASFGGADHHRVFDSGVRAARRVASIPTAEAVR